MSRDRLKIDVRDEIRVRYGMRWSAIQGFEDARFGQRHVAGEEIEGHWGEIYVEAA